MTAQPRLSTAATDRKPPGQTRIRLTRNRVRFALPLCSVQHLNAHMPKAEASSRARVAQSAHRLGEALPGKTASGRLHRPRDPNRRVSPARWFLRAGPGA